MADPRPTVNYGTRYGMNAGEKAKAAADLKAGQARAAAAERGEAYRRVMKKRPSAPAAAMRSKVRRERLNPSPTRVGPTANQFQYTTEQ